jgi:hypothetical protein
MKGAFTSALHPHMPAEGRTGHRPHGKALIDEAVATTPVPFPEALFEPKTQGHDPRTVIRLTLVLLQRLLNPTILKHTEQPTTENRRIAPDLGQGFV